MKHKLNYQIKFLKMKIINLRIIGQFMEIVYSKNKSFLKHFNVIKIN